MFQSMVESLQNNKIPDPENLIKRLQLALTKKEGMLKIPYLMRSSDPKINPLLKHLLWAAIILQDNDVVDRVLGLLAWEKSDEKQKKLTASAVQSTLEEYVREFLMLPSDKACRDYLENLLKSISCLI